MATVTFMRTGQVLRLGASSSKASSMGDQGDALGLLKYLCTKHRVVVFGQTYDQQQFKDEHPDYDVHFVQPDLDGIDDMSTVIKVRECYDKAAIELKQYNPIAAVEVGGATPSSSWIGNPHGTQPLSFAVRYVAPALYAIQHCSLPRLMSINDPRNYPRDSEMTYWPFVRPVAMLSQEQRVFPRKVYDNKYHVHAAYSKAENWWSYDLPYASLDTVRQRHCTVIAHSHMKDGRLKKGRDDVWSTLLCNDDERVVVHGKHWESFSGYTPERFPGPVKPNQVHEVLSDTVCGPMIPCADGFMTGKLRVYVRAGALPLLYGRGEYLTYDKDCRYIPNDSRLRVETAQDLSDAITQAVHSPSWVHGVVQSLRKATEPDFEKIDHLLWAVERSDDVMMESRRTDWLNTFGGYELL